MNNESNFFDLCAACGRAIGRGCAACGHVLERMVRLTYRYWWLVLTLVALAIGLAIYQTRYENLTFKVNAVALLNGPTVQQFDQVYLPLSAGITSQNGALSELLSDKVIKGCTSFRVIDGLGDGTADYIDFKRKSVPTDTVLVQMQDRLCLQFRMKARDLGRIPEVEQALLEYLNTNDLMQQSYATYIENLRDEVAFNHRQALKLDSLTSHYYFRGHIGSNSFEKLQQGTVVMSDWGGDWKVKLFLKDIYAQQQHMQRGDYRLQLASAPVTLENHFSVWPKPVNGRNKMLVIYCLLAWILGCLIAELIDKRKALSAWLKA